MENMGDDKNETWNKYYYKLSQKELRLFDSMEMINHSEIHKTFIFVTNEFSINDLEFLVSVFYPIFGNDMMGRGKFNNEDQNQIVSQNFWFGRMWTDYDKYKCAVMISIDIEAPKLDLCVKW
ncbi:MAG: hypothetical protein M5R37_14170 [Melioribacteraceae bacterium]|nr:hypothetical protein [Melioribacteraceae bacterium]